MRILHTADWHLGHVLYGYDREDEHRAVMGQIREIVHEHAPDVIVISGDIYHTAQPSAATQRLFAETVMSLHDASPGMQIVITAGNHDSGTRHEAFRLPWHSLGVHLVGTICREDLSRHIIEIPEKGFIVAVPYAFMRNFPENFHQDLLDMVAERNPAGLPVVMMAHTTVTGADVAGHDDVTEYAAGGIDAVGVNSFGAGFDYLALGHIHNAQTIPGTGGRVRYAGTPLAVNFDEKRRHTVSLVDIPAHGVLPVVSEIDLVCPRPLVTLPAEGFADWDRCLALLAEFPDDGEAYIRLNVETDSFLPAGAQAEALKLTGDKRCLFCYINARRVTTDTVLSRGAMTVQALRSETPESIAQRFAALTGRTFDDTAAAMFREVVDAVREESREN